MKILPLFLVVLILAGCVTTTSPDGSVRRQIDIEMASLALNSAISAYNIYRDLPSDVQQTRLGQLLDDIDRAEALYNRILERYGKDKVTVVTAGNGVISVE